MIVAGIVAHFGMSGLALVTLRAGLLLVAMGLTGLGTAVRFIPRTVIVGFTNGIAVLIASFALFAEWLPVRDARTVFGLKLVADLFDFTKDTQQVATEDLAAVFRRVATRHEGGCDFGQVGG